MRHNYQSKIKVEKPSIFLRLFCFLFKKELIKIYAVKGCTEPFHFTYIRKGCVECPNDHCCVYWLQQIGDCILLPDGTVDDKSESSYIYKWEYYKKGN